MRTLIQPTRELIGTLRRRNTPKQRAIATAKLRLAWLQSRGRSGAGSVNLLGMEFHYGDFQLFYTLFNEVFVAQTYLVPDLPKRPVIIDAGANIGMATLFFKYFYPDATIMAFEPDATNFKLLQKNVTANKLTNVELFNVALSDQDGELVLYERKDVAGGDIGVSSSQTFRQNYHDGAEIREIKVKAVKLSSLLPNAVQVMKIDIEGAEGSVFRDLAKTNKLKAIEFVVMEFHKIPENPLSAILKALDDNHHTYSIQQWGNDPHNPNIAHCVIKTQRT